MTLIGEIHSVGTFVIGGLCFRKGKEALVTAKAKSFASACGGAYGTPE